MDGPTTAPPTSSLAPTLRFRVEGMDCGGCALKIENALGRMPGVESVDVNLSGGLVAVVQGAEGPVPDELMKTIRRLGYGVVAMPASQEGATIPSAAHDPHDPGHGHGHDHGDDPADRDRAWWQTAKGRLVLLSGLLVGVATAAGFLSPAFGKWPFVAATLVALIPVARRAFAAASVGQLFTIEMLMTIAAAGALVIDAAEEAAVVVFLFAVGELLEGVAAAKARRSIAALSDLTPKTALVLDGETVREVPVGTLVPGQTVLARPGDRIPCDGHIAEGTSTIDESPVSGESMPLRKGPGDTVFAGTVNIAGALRIAVARASADNTIARIIRLVEDAQASKAPVQRFIDRFSRVYMPAVVLVALLVAVAPPLVAAQPWDTWIYRALALLLIACPCALVISTPAAIAAGLSTGARRGLLIKGGAVLETIGSLRTIAFDKTGTLTAGRPEVTDIIGLSAPPDEVLRLAASLERGSSHPIAHAVLARAAEQDLVVAVADDIATIAGRGLRGRVDGRELVLSNPGSGSDGIACDAATSETILRLEEAGKTVSVLHDGAAPIGLIAVRDEPREDAREGLAELSRLGIRCVMLTGDNRHTATAIAAGLGIEARAELLPEDKARIIAEWRTAGMGPIGKVGDGINDAPALAAADVGIAMGAGTDVAIETADAALLRNRVGGVAELVLLSRATMANVRTNVALALGSKALFLVTTVIGLTGMWIAVLADTGATVLVTLNALRLLRFRFRP